MQCQYGTDRNGIDRYREEKGGERLEQMSIPPPSLPPTDTAAAPMVVQKLFPATALERTLLRSRHRRKEEQDRADMSAGEDPKEELHVNRLYQIAPVEFT